MSHNSSEREHRYVEDNPDLPVVNIDSVPNNRPKGSWTNGVRAYKKTATGAACVGWFFPPRLRNKGHHNRKGPTARIHRRAMREAKMREEQATGEEE